MKLIVKKIAINFIGLLITALVTKGIDYENNLMVLAVAALCLYVLNLVVRPLLNLLFMPINLLTLGASRWLINMLILYGVTLVVDDFKIVNINLPTLQLGSYPFPGMVLSLFWSVVLLSFVIQLVIALVSFVLD